MRLRLNPTLRRCLLASFCAVFTLFSAAEAGVMHSQVLLQTYTDFGQNMARYRVNGVNDLLSSIRERDNGVVLTYTGGQLPYTLQHPMISFESQGDNGAYAAVGYNFIATVAHNGCQNPTFTARYVGNENSVHYRGVEYRGNLVFGLQVGDTIYSSAWQYDFKMTRLNKLVTDILPSELCPRFPDNYDYSQLLGTMQYRAGAGTMSIRNTDGTTIGLSGAYAYITGAVQTLTTGGTTSEQYACFAVGNKLNHTEEGISASAPLPFIGAGGDSGSPVWIWNEESQSYVYLSAYQSGNNAFGQSRGSVNFAWDVLSHFDVNVATGNGSTVHINGVQAKENDEEVTDGTLTAKLHKGTVTDSAGQTIEYNGVKGDDNRYIDTWLNLATIKDRNTWYNYDEEYYNVGTEKNLQIKDIFNNSNLVFQAGSTTGNTIEVGQDVDLGVGYLQFSLGEGVSTADFTLQSGGQTDDGNNGQRDYMLNSAGYAVDENVALHIKLTNTQFDTEANAAYYREWRKTGKGDLYLEGNGNNEIFLNVGGSGTTYLNEAEGYAAYNVLAGSGATVVLKQKDNGDADINQIARDFTFGANGATLDFNGNAEMDWYRTNPDVSADGFSINSLSEDAYITNGAADTLATLTYKESGNTTYQGSFTDSAEGGAVKIIYDAGADSKLVLNSIHTDLSHQERSGFEVASGTVELVGTNTVHGLGSATGRNIDRYFNAEDWHYADSTMNVDVAENATFILGSHARLTGNVTVESGGSLIINEGTQNRYEYIEGGYALEDTESSFYTQFYGLKGNILLKQGGELAFRYNELVTTHNTYSGNISGSGSMLIELGTDGAILTLGGDNSLFTPEIIDAVSGGVIAESKKAIGAKGEVATIRLHEKAWLGVKDALAADILPYITADSAGVLALTRNEAEQPDMSGYDDLIIGALEGTSIEYGTLGTTLMANADNQWLLGGGGGELVVNFALQNENGTLVLGNEYTTGSVTLTNASNAFKAIKFAGKVTLDYTDAAALGGATIELGYTNRIMGNSQLITAHQLSEQANGVMLLDNMAATSIDLSRNPALYLGSLGHVSYTGQLTPGNGADYRFGGITGTLEIEQALNGTHGLVVDGQTFSGGSLVLKTPAKLTGQVTVMGYDTAHTDTQNGDITLRLAADDALASAAGITLKDGGILDIHGTQQHFRQLNMAEGSLLTDSSPTWTSGVTFDVAANTTSSLNGVIDVAQITKTGNGTLQLGGIGNYGQLTIAAGTANLTTDTALNNNGIIQVETGAVLNANGHTANGTVVLNGGTIKAGNQTFGGTIFATGAQTGYLTNTGGQTTLTGNIDAASGSELTVSGDAIEIKGEQNNSSGGAIRFAANELRLNNSEEISFGGTLIADGSGHTNNAVTFSSNRSADNTTRNLEHLHIENGTNLTIQEVTWNTIWNIHEMTGNGSLKWNSKTVHWYSSRLVLDGANNFSGEIYAYRDVTDSASANRGYAAFMELAHDRAAQNAVVRLGGRSANSNMSLAINTQDAHMQGLKSDNGFTVLYAGAAVEGAGKDDGGNAIMAQVPHSTRNAAITLTGNGNYSFSGNVYGGAADTETEGYGISIVKQGSGTQTFNGSNVVLNNVSVQDGALNLLSSGLNLRGNAEIYRGATLNTGDTFTLRAGQQLAIMAGNNGGSANLASSLALNGGTLLFDAAGLSSETPVFHLQSGLTTNQSTQNLTFGNTSFLQNGITYRLADGNWAALGLTYTISGADYMNAAVQATATGLLVNFSIAEGNLLWDGTATAATWSSSRFGQQSAPSTENEVNLIFNDSAEQTAVNISGNLNYPLAKLVFDNSRNYTLTATTDNSLNVNSIHVVGSGNTTLQGNISLAENGSIAVDNGTLTIENADTLAGVREIGGTGTLNMNLADGTYAMENGQIGTALGALHFNGAATYDLRNTALPQATELYSGAATTVSFNTLAVNERNASFDGAVSANNITVDGGSLALNGTTAIGDTNNDNYDLIINRGSVSIDGTTDVNGNIEIGNNAAGTAKSVINIGSNGQLNVKKLNSAWGFKTLTVDGILNAEHINLSSGTRNEVNGSGVINATKLTGTNAGTYAFSGVRLNIGSGGIDGARPITLTDMTVGALENWSTTAERGFTLGGTVTFNTAVYNPETAQDTSVGATVTINGNVAAINGASLIKTGVGTLVFNGNSADFNGALRVQEGTVQLNDQNLLTHAGSIRIDAPATLLFNGETAMGHGTIFNNGTVSYSDTAWYNLTESQLTQGGSYTLISGSGEIQGLSLDTFRVNGSRLLGYAAGISAELQQENGTAVLHITGAPIEHRTLTWNGSNSTWNLGAEHNWLDAAGNSTVAYGADSVIFGAAGEKNVSIAEGTGSVSITVENGDYTFSGMEHLYTKAPLQIAAGASATVDALTHISNITLGGHLTLNGTGHTTNTNLTAAEGATDAAFTINGSGVYNGSIANGINFTKSGEGALIFDNTNTGYNGKITINGGVLVLNTMAALGDTNSADRIVIGEGGALDINGYEGAGTGYTVTLNGGTLTNTGNTVGSSKRQVVTSLKLTDNSFINAGSGSDFGLIASGWGDTSIALDAHTLEKTGAGIYYITNAAITGSGKLKVSEGTLQFDPKGNGYLASDIEMAGGTINGTVKLGGDVMVDITKDSTLAAALQTEGHILTMQTTVDATQSGAVSGNGALKKEGAGTLTLATANQDFSGDLLVENGTLKVGHSQALGKNAPNDERTIRIAEKGTLDINGVEGTKGYGYTVTLNGGTLTNSGNSVGSGSMQVVTALQLTGNSCILATEGHNFGLIAQGWGPTAINLGEYTLEKTGAGTYYITNAAITGSGKLKVSEGTLQFDPRSNGHLDSDIEMAGGTIGGTVKLGGDITVDITADSTLAAALQTEGHILTMQTTVDATQSGTISGNGALVKTGAEKLTLTGSTTGFSGSLQVQEGTLALTNSTAAGLLNRTASNTVSNGATIEITNDSALTVSHGITAGGAAIKGNIVKKGSAQLEFNSEAALDIGTMKVEGGSLKLTGNNTTTKNIDRLELTASDATVSQYSEAQPGTNNYLNIGTLSVNSSATLKEEHNAGFIRVGSLHMQEGTESTILTLENNAASTIVSLFELGTAGANNSNFRGDIILTSTHTGDRRSATLVLNNKDIAKDSVITLGPTTSADAKLGLGINAEFITISGLKSELGESAFVYGGTTATQVNSANTCFIGDNSSHTLTINTAADEVYRYNGIIGKGISLVKTGAGTQELAGDSTAFNGSLDVQQGTLRLSGEAVNMMDRTSSSVSVEAGATLHLISSGTLSDKDWDGSGVLGYIEIGNGTAEMTVNASTFSVLNDKGTLVLNKKAQYEGNGTGTAPATLNNNLIIRGDASRSSVRNVDVFNGDIAIEGSAIIAAHQYGVSRALVFNGNINGDTLVAGSVDSGCGQQFYIFTAASDVSELENLDIRRSFSNWTNVIAEGEKSLAKNVTFAQGTAKYSRLFVEADNTIDKLQSAAGDGFMNITKGASLKVNESVDFGGELHLGGELNRNSTASGLSVGNSLTNNADYVTITGNGTGKTAHIEGEVLLGADADTQSASITGKNGTRIENTLIDLAAGTTLHLQDVVLADTTRLTDAPGATVDMSGVTVQAKVGSNLSAGSATTLAAGTTLTQFGEGGKQQTLAQNEACTAYTLNSIENVSLKGSSMTIELSDLTYEELLGLDTPWVGITLANSAVFDTDSALEVYLSVVGGHDNDTIYTMLGYHSGSTSNAVYFNLGEAVPEPTTGTLSLLALAALCARRRRKA